MDPQGYWTVKTQTPKGEYEWYFSIVNDDGRLTGVLDIGESKIALEDPRVEGDEIIWVCNMTVPRVLKFTTRAKFDGDKVFGEFMMGAYGTRTFEGGRARTSTTAAEPG